MTVARNSVLLVLIVAACGGLAQRSQPLPDPAVLNPSPFRFSYPHTAQIAIVSGIGKAEILPGKVKVEVKFLADGGWVYACNSPSENYIRNLKNGDRVTIRPDDKSVHLEIRGKRLRLKIIDADRWHRL